MIKLNEIKCWVESQDFEGLQLGQTMFILKSVGTLILSLCSEWTNLSVVRKY